MVSGARFLHVVGDRTGLSPHARPHHADARLWWRLLGANNRPLGRSAVSYPDLSHSLTAAEAVRMLGAEARVAYLIDVDAGLRTWRLLHPTHSTQVLAISARGYYRQRECRSSVQCFLAALPEAGVLAPQQPRLAVNPASQSQRRSDCRIRA